MSYGQVPVTPQRFSYAVLSSIMTFNYDYDNYHINQCDTDSVVIMKTIISINVTLIVLLL